VRICHRRPQPSVSLSENPSRVRCSPPCCCQCPPAWLSTWHSSGFKEPTLLYIAKVASPRIRRTTKKSRYGILKKQRWVSLTLPCRQCARPARDSPHYPTILRLLYPKGNRRPNQRDKSHHDQRLFSLAMLLRARKRRRRPPHRPVARADAETGVQPGQAKKGGDRVVVN